jgi:guanosine-3',5'-bis(diphosphate) 3'-pyrophosphohydrolase
VPAAPPSFVVGSPLLEGSFELARSLHQGADSAAESELGHPVAVAELLAREGFSEEVVAAALLHEVIEETDTDISVLRERFGPEVAELVAEMTEDASIRPYRARKEEHRERVGKDRRAAAIYAADKLASTRALHAAGEEPDAQRLEHFRTTLIALGDTYPTLPFLAELRTELDRLGSPGPRR